MDLMDGTVGGMLAAMGPGAIAAYVVMVAAGAALLTLGARPMRAVLRR